MPGMEPLLWAPLAAALVLVRWARMGARGGEKVTLRKANDESDFEGILSCINDAAQRYSGVIPAELSKV